MPGEGTIQNVRTIAIANPSAGGDVVYTIPAGVWAELVAFRTTYTAGPTAASRVVYIDYKTTAGAVLFRTSPATTQAATSTASYTFAQGIDQDSSSNVNRTAPLGQKILLTENFTIETFVANGQSSDTFTNTTLQLREYGTPDT